MKYQSAPAAFGPPRACFYLSVLVLALFVIAGCNVDDGGVAVGANGDDADAGQPSDADQPNDTGQSNMDTGSMGTCTPADTSGCADVPGATASGCDTSGASPVCEYQCDQGTSDLNGDLGTPGGDGCESDCAITEGGTEVCDGIDNDCNGTVDDGFSVGDACSDGAGVCEAMGTIVCADDGTATCDASAAQPENEVCDGLDNDCDGTADEENPGGGGNCDTGLDGACAAGTEVCTNGDIVCEQMTMSTNETCGPDGTGDGVDNDCDGTVDEDCSACVDGATMPCYSGPAGTEGRGVCQGGMRTCTGGQFGACNGEQLPSGETCNGADDDCDGTIDEDFGDKGDRCSAGVGACQSNGIRVCTGDGTGTTCNAVAGVPGTETCNGVDDDCDGRVDEGLTRACGSSDGVCMAGTETCSGGSWGACMGATQPGTETCNNLDDDCDGSVDEGISRSCGTNVGACTQGTQVCSSGRFGICSGQGPVAETCNGVDDDCDRSIDEDFPLKGNACTVGVGACERSGNYVCNGTGSGVTCDASPGLAGRELCGDSIDNDCDGSVDEGCTGTCSSPTDCPLVTEDCCYDTVTMQTGCMPPVDPNGNRRICIR